MAKYFFLILLLVASAFVLRFYFYKEPSKNLIDLKIFTGGSVIDLKVETAKTVSEKERGLIFRPSLAENSGMLFLYNDEAPRRFWLKNTLIPLDLIFISKDKIIVEIIKNAAPCKTDPCLIYQSAAAAMYVLEVNAGLCDKQKIKVGDKVEF